MAAAPRPGATIFEGFLVKAPPIQDANGFALRRWHKRFFRLTEKTLDYYQDTNPTTHKGSITVSAMKSINDSLSSPKHEYLFSIVTVAREYYLAASSFDERKQWVDHLR